MDDFETVYRAHGGPVHGYLSRLTSDPWLADELCQETFIRYLRHRDRIQGTGTVLAAWLFRVATNLFRDRLRRRRHEPTSLEGEPVDPATDGIADVETRDTASRVAEEVERLPGDLREVFLLRAHHELTYRRIADVVGASERTVKQRFKQAREILAHRLAPLWDLEEHR